MPKGVMGRKINRNTLSSKKIKTKTLANIGGESDGKEKDKCRY